MNNYFETLDTIFHLFMIVIYLLCFWFGMDLTIGSANIRFNSLKHHFAKDKLKTNIVELKIDRTTLPKDGQKVEWVTDLEGCNDKWKRGEFVAEDDLFLESSCQWDTSWSVQCWRPIDD